MKCRLFIFVFLFLFKPILDYAQGMRIISSTDTHLILEYKPVFSDTAAVHFNDQNYRRVYLASSFSDPRLHPGQPDIKMTSINIGVPSEFGNTIRILDYSFFDVDGKLLPIPEIQFDKISFSNKFIESADYDQTPDFELVKFGEFGAIRELFVQSIIISPIQYLPAEKKIRLYKRITFRIDFSNSQEEFEYIKDSFLKHSVINFPTARKWGKKFSTNLKKGAFNSVLSSGTWYRFEAPEEGIYKIDASLLSSIGIDVDAVDPRTIKIYNNGGYQLPSSVNKPRPEDLVENAIFISGENDGSFNSGDYILFYGRGNNFFEYDTTTNSVRRQKQFFSNLNYYWITSGGNTGKRMSAPAGNVGQFDFEQTETKAFLFLDDDKINLLKSGRLYFGDEFNSSVNTQTYINTLTERIDGSSVNYTFNFASHTHNRLNMTVTENGTTIYSGSMDPATGKYSVGDITRFTASYSGSIPDNRSVLKFDYHTVSLSDKGYLDYFDIEFDRSLKVLDNQIIVFSDHSSAVVKYSLHNFANSDIYIFDITDHSNVEKIAGASISGGQVAFQRSEPEDGRSKYFVCTSEKFKTPVNIENVENSNIHGISPGAELLIITHPLFLEQAERLKEYKESKDFDPISVQIVLIADVFNEFAGGTQDPTAIRDFIRYAFYNWQVKPKFVLLFGDAEYDYLGIEGTGKNFIPPYETVESLDEVFSYPTDDYYAKISGSNFYLDVGIGRISSSTVEDAETAVDKIIQYETEAKIGLWRTTITLIADDAYTSTSYEGSLHTGQSENLARDHIPDYFNKNKIYLAKYPTVQTAIGRRKPAVNQAIIDAVNNGTLLLNYIGHGNPELWAHEVVFEKATTIPLLVNSNYFFLTAATCDFGKYDYPNIQSATEEMLFMPDAGIIGAFTSSRPVYSNQNARLNEDFYSALLQVRDTLNLPMRIGEAYMNGKNNLGYYQPNDEKFHLFGDPTLRLHVPRIPVVIDSVNGHNLSSDIQVKALSNVKVDGTVIQQSAGVNIVDGEGIITVFDSERSFFLQEMSYYMIEPGGVIFRGRASVTDGNFSSNFTVPKDISYENRNGKIIAYVSNDEDDGVGFTKNIIVGGADSSIVDDGEGPSVEIYFDDFSFESSYLVNPNFVLLVRLEDATGLNTTGTGVGHRLEGILNGDEENPIDLTSYFIGDLDAGGKSGVIKYNFSNLTPGDYSIQIKAWDVFNNYSAASSYFTVVDGDGLVMKDVVNYPNPFSSSTTFTLQRNMSDPIKINIKIYTIAGRLIKELESFTSEKFIKLDWDGRDADGNLAANGTYFYKVILQSLDGSYKENSLGKLAIIR